MISDPAVQGDFAGRNLANSESWSLSSGALPALQITGTEVPEPATWVLFGCGLGALFLNRGRPAARRFGRLGNLRLLNPAENHTETATSAKQS
jgi:hypothetical protein